MTTRAIQESEVWQKGPVKISSGASAACVRQDADEGADWQKKPTPPKTDSSGYFGISSLILLILLAGCSVSTIPSQSTDIISFYRGYTLQKEYLAKPDIPYDLDRVIAGMRAAEQGEKFPLAEEELEKLMRTLQNEIQANQMCKNLSEAESHLRTVAYNSNAKEIVPGKLYSMTLKNGHGRKIAQDEISFTRYTTFSLKSGEEILDFSSGDGPIPLSLADMIPGIAQGTEGMQIGERRKLYIHPDLAFGSCGGGLQPNQLLIIEIEVIGAEDPTNQLGF